MAEAAGRKGWTRVAFGDVVRHIKDKVDPDTAGLDRYIAGEHMDSDDLRLRRWGEVGDGYLGPAFHMRFKPGQVLYGSRRSYLRKVALADFEGITSNTTYVFESANPEVLLPEFLPFVMQTESFHEHSKRESKGSVNPYVNFSDLAWYEFDLPPVEKQHGLIAVLQAGATAREGVFESLRSLELLLSRVLIDSYQMMVLKFPLVGLSEFGEVTMGRQKAPKYRTGANPTPFLSVANIDSLEIRVGDVQRMDFDQNELRKYRLKAGDVLLTEGDLVSEFRVGRPALFRDEIPNCCFQNTLIRLRPDVHIDSRFLLALMEGARLNFVFAKASKSTTVTHLGLGRFRQIRLPMPSEDVRNAIGQRLETILEERRLLRRRLDAVHALGAEVLSEVWRT